MNEPDVRDRFQQAMRTGDAALMRQAFERLFGGGLDALSADAEYETRHEDYVMEMPQSGERIRGRDAMRSMQEAFPDPPTIAVRRVTGADRTWVIEAVNEYGEGDVWYVVVILEFEHDGRIRRDTRYYAKPFEPPTWRSAWVEPI